MAEDDDHNRRGGWLHPRNDGKKYDVTLKIMLAVIISLSVVVFLVILLHIYARWVLRRQARRRAAMRHLGLVLAHGPDSTELTPKTGLDPSVIALLPTFVFKQPDPARDNSSLATEAATSMAVAECAVCLNVLEDGEMVRVLPNCKHMFHVECINKWLGSHSTCPLCRTEAQPEPNEMSSEPSSPNAPPVERVDSSVSCVENAPDGAGRVPGKGSGPGSRLSSFRRILSRERSSRRIQIQPQDYAGEDVERQ